MKICSVIGLNEYCTVPGCSNKYYAKGYCHKHYANYLRSGHPLGNYKGIICSVDGCNKKSNNVSGKCSYHERIKGTNIKGDKNIHWRGGVAEYKDHSLMKRLRLKKLKLENYTCEICGGKAVEVHHKDGTKDHHSIDNFLAVCHKCHIGVCHKNRRQKPRKYSEYSLMQLAKMAGVSVGSIRKYYLMFKISDKIRSKIEQVVYPSQENNQTHERGI